MDRPERDAELAELRSRLEETEETLRAICSGEVDALVVPGTEGDRVFTLHGAERPYETLIESMQQGALSLSSDGIVLYCNRGFAELIERQTEEIVSAPLEQFLDESSRQPFESILAAARAKNGEGELHFTRPDGRQVPAFVSLTPLPLGKQVVLCMVVTDLTDRKNYLQLREKSRRKDEFLAMLAHELRNPLAPIRNAVTLLNFVSSPDERLAYAREVIDRQVHHLAHLVDDLLDMSRISLGKVKLQLERIELGEVVRRAIETSQPLIEARRHNLHVSVPNDGLEVLVDPTRMAQVISNLLLNAAKYTEENGEIWISAERSGDRIAIHVRDNGIGITPQLLPRVFELFTQGDRSLARSEGGLGIGLSLVRLLVGMHGGTVEAQSGGAGKGSEFIVRLSAAPRDYAPVLAIATKTRRFDQKHCCRILVVDDNVDGAKSLAVLLRVMGNEVTVAHSGPEALETARRQNPQVFLLDIGLPGMSGHELAQQLRSINGFDKSLMIAMTGYGQDEDRARSLQSGFDHHLVKPIDVSALTTLISEATSPA